LINCLDARTAISKAIAEQIRNTFDPDQIFETEVPVNTAFEKAEALKKTIFQHDGTASGARAFRKLAKELISILKG
jgi:cellulose biosynthesis protein BcsQ